MVAKWVFGVLAVLFSVVTVQAAHAGGAALAGTKTITLVTAGGERLPIGTVAFVPDGDGAQLTVTVDSPEMKDEFLSMRPFRCLRDAKEWWCHLAYPYELTGRVTAADLTDLEYSLLFIGKGPNFFGIDAWNGLYFKLAVGADGSIAGNLHGTDLNVLAVPPADRKERLIVPSAVTAAEPGAHRFARVEIR